RLSRAVRRSRCTLARDRRFEALARRAERANVLACAESDRSSKARSDKAVRARRRQRGPIRDRPEAPGGSCGFGILAERERGCGERARERRPCQKGGGTELHRVVRAASRAGPPG